MTRREVLHVCHNYYPPFLDVARQYNALFPRDEWRITTIFLSGVANDSIIHSIGGDEVIFFEQSSQSLHGLKLKLIARLRDIAAQRNFAFAIAHRFKALYLCTQIAGLFTFGVHHRPGGYRRWGRRWYVYWKKSQLALLGVSNFVRDDMRADLPSFPTQKIETLYNHIDIEALRHGFIERAEARKKLQLPSDEYLFVTIGRLHPDKDPHTLLRAFAKYCASAPEGMLVLIGKGRLETELRSLAASLDIAGRVIFTGPVVDAWQYLRAFDSFILSSDHEPFGMVLLEAMAAQLPIATTSNGGAGEVIGEAGFDFDVGDSDTLAALLARLRTLDSAALAELRQRMDERLYQLFSDAKARDAFWKLPAMRDALQLSQR